MSNVIDVFRTEKKYFIKNNQVINLKKYLDLLLEKDSFSQNDNGYIIKTLYFDSYNDKDYYDKINGDLFRKKIRMRTYGTDGSSIKLELKEKENANQRKRSVLLSKSQASKIIIGDYSPLLEIGNELSLYLYSIMQREVYRPKCLMSYNRLAYYSPTNQIRVTFDTNIKYSFSDFELFDDSVKLLPVNFDPILEVKYDGFLLQPIRDAINNFNLVETSISKYVLARQDKK